MTLEHKIIIGSATVIGAIVGGLTASVISTRREQKHLAEQAKKTNKELDRINTRLNAMTSEIK